MPLKRDSKLVGTRSLLDTTSDPLETLYNLPRLKTVDKSTDTLEITVTATYKGHIADTAIVINLIINLSRACAASNKTMFHN